LDFRSDMGKRHPLYSAKNRKGAVVFGPTVYEVQLLPYEKQLIKTIGITEEEYQLFASEVRRRGYVRPAEYDHIPDIQMVGPAAGPIIAATYLGGSAAKGAAAVIATNIAIGLTLTGVAYLLTPKPKMPSARSGGGTVNLGNVTGSSRFTPTSGFDTLAELADYASTIPLIFGRYDNTTGVGGMLITPKLIWSRMFSHGTLQRAKLLFVVGEQGLTNPNTNKPSGIARPDLEGIFLGNNALDHIFEDFFAFYWKPNTDVLSKIRRKDLIEGTTSEPDSGDPDTPSAPDEQVFLCPTADTERAEAFCHAYSPVNSTEFGAYAPIANGNSYRLNYRIISIVADQKKKARRLQTLSRIKIAGDQNLFRDEGKSFSNSGSGENALVEEVRKQDQESLGRNYSPRMGVVKLTRSNGDVVRPTGTEMRAVVDTFKGDKIQFLISHSSINKNFYKTKDDQGESVDDINTSVESMQLAADEAMQLGEKFAIAGSIWKIIRRSQVVFNPEAEQKTDQIITLECIDVSQSITSKIGIVSEKNVVTPDHEYIGDSLPGGAETQQGIGEAFFPLTRVESAIVLNNRPAAVTEIGLKSTVYQKLNGLCAFNSLISSGELDDYEDDNMQVNSGTITSTIVRASVFRIFVRKAGIDQNGERFVFKPIPLFFVIRGTRPVAQYNFIRIVNVEAVELEFKFVPVAGSELRGVDDEENMVELVSSASTITNHPVQVEGLGTLAIQTSSKEIKKGSIKVNKEFLRDPSKSGGVVSLGAPSSVTRVNPLPGPISGLLATSIARVSNIANLDSTAGKTGAFAYELLGSASTGEHSGVPVGGTKTIKTKEIIRQSPFRWISLNWTFTKVELPADHYVREKDIGENHTWSPTQIDVIGSTGGFNLEPEGEDGSIYIKRGAESSAAINGVGTAYSSSNPFAYNPGTQQTMTWSGRRFRIASVEQTDTIGGRNQGYYYEMFGSAAAVGAGGRSQPFLVTETNSGAKTIKLSLTSTARQTSNNFTGIEEFVWESPAITVLPGTTSNWDQGEEFSHTVLISDNNPFKTSYSRAGALYRIGSLNTTTTPETFTSEAVFAGQTQYSDISQYREFVEKSNSSSPEHQVVYVNEIQENDPVAQFNDLTLAGLSLKAGRNFSQLDQLRCWVAEGIHVERLHPDRPKAYGDNNAIGSSNLLTDLVYYLFTDQTAGAGALLGMTASNPSLIDKETMKETSKFLDTYKLAFNGPIVERTNLRQFVIDTAPNFLCNFVISDGKFSLKPALPTYESGAMNEGPIPISQLFTNGNILEDSFKVEYLRSEERRSFKAVVRYRQERQNKLPEERTLTVVSKGFSESTTELLPQEQFDLTQFCTSKEHAKLIAKYFLSLRELVTHTINFSTTVHGLNLTAGSYIKVVTESSPYNSANNGTVSSSGAVTSVLELVDGQYNVTFFKSGSEDVETGIMTVSNNHVQDSTFQGSVFTVNESSTSQKVYVVEQLTFSEEGTVDIVASEHPCDDDGKSKLVQSVLHGVFKIF